MCLSKMIFVLFVIFTVLNMIIICNGNASQNL